MKGRRGALSRWPRSIKIVNWDANGQGGLAEVSGWRGGSDGGCVTNGYSENVPRTG
jgi:hypothetical protein